MSNFPASKAKLRGFASPMSLAVLLCLGAPVAVQTDQPSADTKTAAESAFSFAVYGDSRTMMNLPYKAEQQAEATKLMVDMFNLVLPEKVSEEVVAKDVKLTYDPHYR